MSDETKNPPSDGDGMQEFIASSHLVDGGLKFNVTLVGEDGLESGLEESLMSRNAADEPPWKVCFRIVAEPLTCDKEEP